MSEITTQPGVTLEIASGQGLSLSRAARRFPSYRAGRPINPATIWRWLQEGVRLPDGRRVRLEAARLSGRWLTSEPALERFLAAQTPALGDDPPHTTATQKQRKRAAERAARELDKIGI